MMKKILFILTVIYTILSSSYCGLLEEDQNFTQTPFSIITELDAQARQGDIKSLSQLGHILYREYNQADFAKPYLINAAFKGDRLALENLYSILGYTKTDSIIGDLLFKQGSHPESAEPYLIRAAIDNDEASIQHLDALATIYSNIGNFKRAFEIRTIISARHHQFSINFIGDYYYVKEDYQQALQHYVKLKDKSDEIFIKILKCLHENCKY